jgi:hypothetical protein
MATGEFWYFMCWTYRMFHVIQSRYVYCHSDWLLLSQILIHLPITVIPFYIVVVATIQGTAFKENERIFVNKHAK